jgi:putative peptidoglycan lipid II flippase
LSGSGGVAEPGLARLTGVTIGLVAVSVLGLLLGVMREASIAHALGSTWVSDAYFVAILPAFTLIDLGTDLSLSVVPLFVRWRATGGEAYAAGLFRTTARWIAVLAAAAVLVCALAAPLWLRVVAPGLPEAAARSTVRMVWILAPGMALTLPALLRKARSNAEHRLVGPAVAGLLPSLGIILGAVAFADRLGAEVVVAGLALGLAGQAFALWRLSGGSARPLEPAGDASPGENPVPAILKSWGLVILGATMYKLEPLVQRHYASLLGPGEISGLTYAYRIAYLPNSLFTLAAATVALPTLSSYAAVSSPKLRWATTRMLATSAAVLTAMAVALFAVRAQVVDVLLRHGRFVEADAGRTVSNLGMFCLAIVPLGMAMMLVRLICVLGAQGTYACAGIASAAVYLVAARLLVPAMGASGLALASAVGSTCLSLLLGGAVVLLLRRSAGRAL